MLVAPHSLRHAGESRSALSRSTSSGTLLVACRGRDRPRDRAVVARHLPRPGRDTKSNEFSHGPELPADPPKRGHGRRLSLTDRYKILELHQRNPTLSYRELAKACGVSTETAHRTVLTAGRAATDLMAAYAEPMLRRWLVAAREAAIRGDHRPVKDWLLHAGVLDPLPDGRSYSGPAVVIVNAPLPGMPGAAIAIHGHAASDAVPLLTGTSRDTSADAAGGGASSRADRSEPGSDGQENDR